VKRKWITLLFCGVALPIIAIPVILTWRQVKRSPMNRKLVNAVATLDVPGVRDSLRAGADPNSSDSDSDELTLRTALLNLFHYRHGPSDAQGGEPMLASILLTVRDGTLNLDMDEQKRRGSEIALLLLQYGANPDERGTNADASPIVNASRMGAADVVQSLLDHGANVEGTGPQDGPSPLSIAAERNDTPMALILLKHGANPNHRERVGEYTPMMNAVMHENESLVRALLEKKADLTPIDWTDRTALDWARAYGNEKIVHLLMQAGAKK
jgi:hypothetical protein